MASAASLSEPQVLAHAKRRLFSDGDQPNAYAVVDTLQDGNVFHSPTAFQLKAILYHAGILTERGAEPHRLEPTADTWKLRQPLEPIDVA